MRHLVDNSTKGKAMHPSSHDTIGGAEIGDSADDTIGLKTDEASLVAIAVLTSATSRPWRPLPTPFRMPPNGVPRKQGIGFHTNNGELEEVAILPSKPLQGVAAHAVHP